MNPETGSFSRCVKHPSHVFTGFCSTCLVERLSNVDSAGCANSPFCSNGNERVSTSESVFDSQRKNGGVRVRKTLLSLFELDDLNYIEKMEHKGLEDRARASGPADVSGLFCLDGKKSESLGDESSRDSNMSFWLHSKISMKGLKWGSGSIRKKGQMQDGYLKTGVRRSCLENKRQFQASCDWTHDPSKVFWEKSRHSWDGSMMSKALVCSFFCLEEEKQDDDSAKFERSLHEEAASFDIQRSPGVKDLHKVNNNGLFAQDNSISVGGSFEDVSKELHREEICQDIDLSGVCKKKSNGWSRVWDWRITTPFRDFSKRNCHVLERSLSESWRDNHNDDSMKNYYSDIEPHRDGTLMSNSHVNQSLYREIVTTNDNRQRQKPDRQRMRELKLSRSHSVRYSSPRNLDNGLLRFYLTPLRTSTRNVTKCKRTSHSLARGFLGL